MITLTGLDAKEMARLAEADLSQDELAAVMPIRVDSVDETGQRLLGEYRLSKDGIEFLPPFPFLRGISYRVEYGSQVDLLALQDVPSTETTRVMQIYPTTDALPANLLKFYITFSSPMSRGFGYDFIELYNEDGSKVVDPFPEIGVELWDPNQQQYTLLLDPGRIKRGIAINESMGLPMVSGNSYKLVIDAAWPDANGAPIGQSFEKTFRVVDPDHESPDHREWLIKKSAHQSSNPVAITFTESMDYSLADRFVWVEDESSEIIDGTVTLSEKESRWSFKRASGTWSAGEYAVGVHSRLEDLAGNQIEKTFEVDVQSQPSAVTPIQIYTIPFTIQ